MTFRDIHFPETFQYSSDSENIPLEFYESTFPIANEIDLLLGYFSSNAFKVLSESFAEFIFNGGTMRIITNHIFSFKDKENLIVNNKLESEDEIIDIFGDIEKLEKELSEEGKHFFDCLKFLIKHDRLKILPVKFNHMELAHCKKMILYDGFDYISTDGSINFTLSALMKNSESFNVNVPWEGEIFKKRINTEKHNFDKIFNKQHTDYEYLNSNQIESVINKIGRSKEIQDLLEDSIKIDNSKFNIKIKKILELKKVRFEKKINLLKSINKAPRFPFTQGPRKYQIEAYENWSNNNYSGIFAMATGTGKTITSLNCVVEEYNKHNEYHVIILVPTQVLVNQWQKETMLFNFNNVITSYDKDWDKKLNDYAFDYELGLNTNFIFISTYEVYNRSKFQNIFKEINIPDLILIADEVHNMGTKRSISNYLNSINKKIGLSATPNRKYDEEGTLEIEKYFNSYSPRHTFNYSMLKAIENGFLTKYEYHPRFVKLNKSESEEYAKISTELLKYFDFETGKYRDGAEMLLIKRKRIIHKANSKKNLLSNIIEELLTLHQDFKHCIIYVPEGIETDFSNTETSIIVDEDRKIIDDYTGIVSRKGIKVHQFVGDTNSRDLVLKKFETGKIKVLTAMKMLDEGVDIPATKFAIFCSSSGNPRQFIQRRGRILRKFEGKEKAVIYDMIVEPNDIDFWEDYPFEVRIKLHNMEINIFKSELERVVNFLYASDNLSEIFNEKNKNFKKLVELSNQFEIDIYEEINKLKILDA